MLRSVRGAMLASFILSGSALAQVDPASSPQVIRPWARETAGRQANGAAYLTVRNPGSHPDRLLGASTGVAERAELHISTIDAQGVAMMRPAEAIEVPVGGEVRLQPGGMHVMLVGLKQPLAAGTSFPLTLRFERAGMVEVTVAVESVRGTGGGSHEHGHGHGTGH